MEIVNPIAASLAQSAAVTRQQSADKSTQIRRAQTLRKNVAAPADTFEHQVESAEELAPVHDEHSRKDRRRGSSKPKGPAKHGSADDAAPPRLDVTA